MNKQLISRTLASSISGVFSYLPVITLTGPRQSGKTTRRQSDVIFRIINEIDPSAFVSQSAVIGVYGEGFDRFKVRRQKSKA